MFGSVEKALEGGARRNKRDAKTSQRGKQVMVKSFESAIAVNEAEAQEQIAVFGERAFDRENLERMNAS